MSAAVATATLLAAIVAYSLMRPGDGPETSAAATRTKAQGGPSAPSGVATGGPPTVNLSDSQLGSVKVEPASER